MKNFTVNLIQRAALLLLFGVFSFTLWAQPSGSTVLLQGFNWESWRYGWWNVLNDNAAKVQAAKFNGIWLPPPSDAAASQGYLPRQLRLLNSAYGTQTQLQTAIDNFRNRNVKVIGDIVINHRVGTANWGDFTNPAWGCWSVVKGDEWTGACGSNYDSGDGYSAARDLDHANANVRSEIVSWMQWLKNTIRFDGWRYDYSKGYAGSYTKIYNDNTSPWISIREVWTDLDLNNVNAHRQKIVDWIDATSGSSTAFDFTTKGVLQQAVRYNEYWRLNINGQAPGVIGWWPAKSVTFIDNHDTGSTQNHWPFPGDNEKVLQGYAYILTHPGIPMVFWDHYFDWGSLHRDRIQALINVRKSWGISSTSSLAIQRAETGLYAAIVGGKVAVKLGPNSWSPGSGWTLRTSGINYAVWTYGAAVARLEDGVEEDEEMSVSLEQNYPNPTDGRASLAFIIAHKQHVSIAIFNSMGKRILEVVNKEYDRGRHQLNVDLTHLEAGVYTYRMVAGGKPITKRLVIK